MEDISNPLLNQPTMEEETQNPSSLSSIPPPTEDPEPATKKLKMSSTTTTDDDEQTTTTIDGAAAKPRRYKRRKVAIFFAYCGVGYQGMQKNPGAKTIEGDFEEALYHAGAVPEEERGQHKRFDWARSARTDKGVSAVGQVVSGRFFVDPPGFVQRLNENLCPQIRVFGFKRATPTFNAKKFCDRRRYVYLLPVFALDPSCHRDRESVLASLGSGNELAKCVACSERGRKVGGLMGNRRDLEGKVGSRGLVQSGISLNGESALLSTDEKESEQLQCDVSLGGNDNGVEELLRNDAGVVDSQVLVQSGISSNSEAALLTSEDKEKQREECNGAVNLDSDAVDSGLLIGEERTAGELNGCGNGEEGRKESDFKYGDEERERFCRILKYFEGTHNFHNFTTRTKAEDPSAKRYIVSFEAKTTLTIEGIEFVKCEVVGQSFMLHQIRKMMGLAVSIMRNFAPESIFERAFQQDVHINVPTAPEVGLFLDECFFNSYNNRWKDTHEPLSMKDFAEEAEEFKLKHIYSHIAKTELKEGTVGIWLHSLNYRNYSDLRPVNVDSDARVTIESKSTEAETLAEEDSKLVDIDGDAGVMVKSKSTEAEPMDEEDSRPVDVDGDAVVAVESKSTEAKPMAEGDSTALPS